MAVRIEGAVERPTEVEILVDGKPVKAFAGECVAAALLAAGINTFRTSPNRNDPRGPFCMMGVCQECVVRIDGRVVTACMEPVHDGLEVTLGGAVGWPEGFGGEDA